MFKSSIARIFLLSFLFVFSMYSAFSQGSVHVITTVAPPYSTLLSEYYSGDQPRLSVMLLNIDASQPFLQGYLKMTIQGQGIKLQNVPYGNYPTIDLTTGAMVTLSQSDLAPYFNSHNLAGSTGLNQNRLPEGFYQFCFEVYEKHTNRLIGSSQCAQAYLTLNDPPYLLLPESAKAVSYTNPFNLLFQWNPRHIDIANTQYQFDLVEVWDTTITPQAAFYTAKPVYSTKVTTSNLFYGPGEPPLLTGKKYAWRVKAIVTTATNELEPFKNDGYSEIFWFKLQGECPTLQKASITADPKTNKTTLSWVTDPSNVGSTSLMYRKKGTSKWATVDAPTNQATLTGLDWATDYEYELGNRCVITDDYVYGSLQSFKTLTQDTANCVPSGPAPLTNHNPLAMLRAGDTIYASDFVMRLTNVSGANGQFSGEGYLGLIVPTTTTQVAIRASFQNISVNTDHQMFAGKMVSMYDATLSNIVDANNEGGANVGEVKTGLTSAIIVNTTIDPNGTATITPVTSSNGDTTGYTVTLAGVNSPPITINTNKLPVTVQDNKGKLYTIDKNGKITPAGQVSGALLAGKGPDQLNQLNTDKGTVTFVAHPDQVYVFDPYQDVYKKSSIFDHEYETLTGSYRVGNKFLTTGSTDKIIAKLSGLADGIDEDSIHFITGKGIEFAAKKTASLTYEITLLSGPAGDAQELYAIYRDSDAAKKNPNASSASFTYSLGKLDIATYEPKTLNVKLVPVGNAQVDKTQISTRLNQIYNPIGITWTVDVASSFPITQDWDVDSSGSLNITGAGKYNQYSNEMKLLNAAYLQSNSGLNASSPYLFVFSTSPTSGPDEQGRGILGDMLRNKQFGYIFLPNNNDIGQTAAHELGHGVFHLNHTFDTQYYLSQGDLPANLMDYSGGDQFAKLQWDAVYVPSLVIGIFDKEGDAQLNSTELDYVKFLFKIRNANKNNTSFALSSFSDPFQGLSRDRIFIAGQIFPSIKINYDFKTGMNVNAKNISLKTINNLQCIVVDDKIQLYLPADLPTIKYSQILLNFLTNVSTTDITNSLGGEFLDYDTYKLVVGDASIPLANWDGKDGSWLKSDREGLTTRFKNACDYIIKNKITGRLGPFLQIAAFYDYVGMKSISVGHQIRWYKGASKLVHALGGQSEDDRFGLEGGNMAIANDVELILNELNLKICDYAITQFYELFYGQYAKTPLIGDAAYQFDKQFVETEQGVIAVPIYSKTSASTLSTFQDMADKDPNGTHGAGAMALSKVTPGFDDFDPPALVTDVQFRIDLPLLMLYLDIHKPTANSFKNHLESDGTLNNEYKTILQPYADALK